MRIRHARIWLVSCALLAACATPAHMPKLDEVDASGPLVLETAYGPLSAERSRAILTALANETGASDILLRHLALEQAVTDSPLVVGNKVTLLRDGPATYKSMYQAISEAKSSINIEVYILENDEMGKQLRDEMKAKLPKPPTIVTVTSSFSPKAPTMRRRPQMLLVGIAVMGLALVAVLLLT